MAAAIQTTASTAPTSTLVITNPSLELSLKALANSWKGKGRIDMTYEDKRAEPKDLCIIKKKPQGTAPARSTGRLTPNLDSKKKSQKSPGVLTRIIVPLKTQVLKISHRFDKYFVMDPIKNPSTDPPTGLPTSESSVAEWKEWYRSTPHEKKLKLYQRLIMPQKPFTTRIPLSIAVSFVGSSVSFLAFFKPRVQLSISCS